jgi:KaiC/GvpD/RAD55 family RecA-like ATPase
VGWDYRLRPTISKLRLLSIITSFALVAVITFFLLSLFPFYPLSIVIVLSLVLGAAAIELPGLALLISVLLSVLGALYQNPFAGLVFFAVLIIFSSLISGWFDMAMVTASWVLAFFVTPALALLPTVLSGYRDSRENALKVGAFTGISIFLLSWALAPLRRSSEAGLMLVPSASSYVAKPIPQPWHFQAFLPSLDIFSPDKLGNFYAPLGSSVGDYRIYALIVGWAVAGFLIAFLANKWKGYFVILASVIGVLPLIVMSLVLAVTPLLQVAIALVGTVVVAFGYKSIQPMVTAPTLPTFKSLSALITTGIPQKYSILLGSPACDERNLVVEQFIGLGVDKKTPAFMVTSDPSFAQSAVQKFGDMLTVLVANPRATSAQKNIVPLTTGVQNLTSLNIELVKLVKDRAGSGAQIILDVVSDVMLAQKMLMTRKWVSDLLPRFESWGFTVLGVFNPGLHSNEEVQGLIELFNGYVQIQEKDYQGKARKLIAVRKMADLQYNEAELVIEKEQLAPKKGGGSGLRKRFGR